MALTQSDIDTLTLAIASNETEVRLEGRLVKYRTTDEMIKARALLIDILNGQSRTQRVTFRYGFTTQRDC